MTATRYSRTAARVAVIALLAMAPVVGCSKSSDKASDTDTKGQVSSEINDSRFTSESDSGADTSDTGSDTGSDSSVTDDTIDQEGALNDIIDATAGETGSDDGSGSEGGGTDAANAWAATASSLGWSTIGSKQTFTCTPRGTEAGIWGTGTYTSDSSICTAAVHAGVITFDKGGDVRVEIAAGLDSYQGSTAHGVTSDSYSAWTTSIKVSKP